MLIWPLNLSEDLASFARAFIAMPRPAKFVAGGVLLLAGALLALMLATLILRWSAHLSTIDAAKPRISRVLGYVDSAPLIGSKVSEVGLLMEDLIIMDNGASGRGGALMQQQLRELASDAGLTVTGSQVKPAEDAGALTKLAVTLQIQGGPEELNQFLTKTHWASPELFVENLQLEAMRRLNRRRSSREVKQFEADVRARVDVFAFGLTDQNE